VGLRLGFLLATPALVLAQRRYFREFFELNSKKMTAVGKSTWEVVAKWIVANWGGLIMTDRVWKCVLIMIGVIVLSAGLMLFLGGRRPSEADVVMPPAASSGGESFVYRFDPSVEAFAFTYTIPTANANPLDVVVVSGVGCQDVWFTESGVDRIGRLTYTDTNSHVFREYTLTTSSQPSNLVAGGGFIWFTESGRDRIGRLDPATGEVDEFAAAAGSYPADLDCGPDGSIWFTEMKADQIARLVITSTEDYGVTEYFTSALSGGRPYGIVVRGGSVYFAETANDRVTRFTPPNSWMRLHDLFFDIPDEPYALAVDGWGKVWATERAGNRISQYEFGTVPIIAPYSLTPTNSLPTSVVVDANNHLWFTQWHAGQIGRLIPGGSPQKDYYPLPLPGLAPTGIATDDAGGIWVLASRPYRTYLPFVSKCWNASIPPFGVQFYGQLDASNGFDDIVDAGAQWARVPLSWASIEPSNTTPENYNWSGLDLSLNNAAQEGVHLIVTIAGQPSWAATYAQGPVTDTADIIEFVGALVERYDGDGVDDAPGSPQVRYFELYNEPDNADVGHALHGGWGYWGHNGAGYAELLQALYPVVNAANPQANLVLGGLALDWFEPDGPFDPQFFDDVLSACQGQDCFDVMNFHYYIVFRSNWESYGRDIIGKANYVRQQLAAYGLEGMPLVCTETSLHAGASWGSDEFQSRYVVKGFVRGIAAELRTIVWYKAHDIGDAGRPGLLDENLQPKPSYWAFQEMTTMLSRALYQRPLTLAETGSEQVEGYVFQVCGGRLDVVWTEDDTYLDPDDNPILPLTVQAQTLRVVDKFGVGTWLNDADDGVADGQITILVGGSPLYLEYNP
jgi:streptogramin lyase